MKVCVVGLGRAGLPLTAVIAESGLDVVGFDINEERVAQINKGENPIPEEPGLAEILEKHAGKNLKAVSRINDAADCNAYIVIVPLFLDSDHKPDFSIIDDAFEKVASVLQKGDLVVLETTVPPGTVKNRIRKLLESESGMKAGDDFHLAYSPERIMTGYSISRFKEFPKVVGGLTPACTDKAYKLYSNYANPVKVEGTTTAELVKVTEGVYRDVNIALANELYKLCDKLDIDFWQVREASAHQYCDIHEPGIVGGHCIPVYPWFLMNDHEVPLTSTARHLNDDMADYLADKVSEITPSGKVAVAGLSYRPGVYETIHTQSHLMIKALNKHGYEVYGTDPLFNDADTQKYFNLAKVSDLSEMDAIVLMYEIPRLQKQLEGLKEKVVDVKKV